MWLSICRKNSSPRHSICARARAGQGPLASSAGTTKQRTCARHSSGTTTSSAAPALPPPDPIPAPATCQTTPANTDSGRRAAAKSERSVAPVSESRNAATDTKIRGGGSGGGSGGDGIGGTAVPTAAKPPSACEVATSPPSLPFSPELEAATTAAAARSSYILFRSNVGTSSINYNLST